MRSERDALAHEVRHRVYNNLQTLLALVSLISNADNPSGAAALDELHLRIRAMAASQRYLYQLDSTGAILISGFLDAVLQDISPFFPSTRPHLSLNGSDIHLPLEVARNLACSGGEPSSSRARGSRSSRRPHCNNGRE